MSILSTSASPDSIAIADLASRLTVGDVVFVRIPFKPFGEVAAVTDTWTHEATGTTVGKVETFSQLFADRPDASLLHISELAMVYDGRAGAPGRRGIGR